MALLATAYLLGLGTPFALLGALALLGNVRHGWWTRVPEDDDGCDACRGIPDDQWSPFHVCPRCGSRHVRTYLIRALGERLTMRIVPARGPRDEPWLAGETE